jgi:ribulose-5-phosphate 4-epimerase/fuculose-1-phosphate aldolase
MLERVPAAERPSHISQEEWEVRIQLAACYRLVDLQGWSDMTSTHISARVPGPDHHFLINPHGMLFDEITASSLIKVDLHGRVVNPSDYQVNPAGFVIHSAIHMARADAMFALHTHTAAGVGVASQKDGLLPVTQQALAIMGDVAYHGFEGPALRFDERARIVSDLGDRRILFLRNHGLLTIGRTAGEAFMAMYRAERACRFQLAFQQSGAAPSPIPDDIQESTAARGRKAFWGGGALDPDRLEWPALLRRLDRIDASYRG